MDLSTESRLIAKAQKNIKHFSAIYDLYASRVFRYFMARIGDTDSAEDLTSQTFLKVIEAFPKYVDQGKPFGAWCFRIAHNALIDYVRTESKYAPSEGEELEVPSSDDLLEKTHNELLYEKVKELLKEFPQEEQNILLLKLVSGLKFSEIAEIMGKKEGTVKTKYFRNLEKLRGKAGGWNILVLLMLNTGPLAP